MQTHEAYCRANKRFDQAYDQIKRLRRGDPTYAQAEAEFDRAEKQWAVATTRATTAEERLAQSLRRQYGDSKTYWKTWASWVTMKYFISQQIAAEEE